MEHDQNTLHQRIVTPLAQSCLTGGNGWGYPLSLALLNGGFCLPQTTVPSLLKLGAN